MALLDAILVAAHKHPVWEDFDTLTWIIVGVAALVSVWVIWKAVHYTLHPGETEADHIKRSILAEPDTIDVQLSSEDAGGTGTRGAPSANGA